MNAACFIQHEDDCEIETRKELAHLTPANVIDGQKRQAEWERVTAW